MFASPVRTKKDNKSGRACYRADPARQSQQYHNRQGSLMASSGYMSNSSRSPSQKTLNAKPTISKGGRHTATKYMQAVRERALQSEQKFLDRMASVNSSQDHPQSRNGLLSARTSTMKTVKVQQSGDTISNRSGLSKKSKGTKPSLKKGSKLKQNDKKDGIVPYQSQISLKNKKVQKRPSQNQDIFDHYLASKVQAHARVSSRVKNLNAKEERKSPKKTKKKRKTSAPVLDLPMSKPKSKSKSKTKSKPKPSPSHEEEQQQTTTESLHQSPPRTQRMAHERIFDNTDLSSVMPEATMDLRISESSPPERAESYTPYYTPCAKTTEILQAAASNPISTFQVQIPNSATVKIQDSSPVLQNQDTSIVPSTPTTTEPDPENMPFEGELNAIDKECYAYVNVEAYALARCAQRTLKQINQIGKDKRKQLVGNMVNQLNQSISKLESYQKEDKGCSLFATQAAYVCQSILMFEQYKLEESSTDVHKRIKQLLHILKHLAFHEAEDKFTAAAIQEKSTHNEKKAHMFARVYRNHLLVLMYLNADQLEVSKIEKVFNIVEFLINDRRDNIEHVLTQINVKQDYEKVMGRNRTSLTKND